MWLEKKILVPTDFSDSAIAAANVGLKLAQEFRVPLVLMHVYGIPGQKYPGVDLNVTEDFVHSLQAAARTALNDEASRLAHKGVNISVVLSEGAAWEQILKTAKMIDAGLIVLGTHGRRGLPRAILGSVAERIVRLSRIAVLTVHAPDEEAHGVALEPAQAR
jgi:nucleotide-binding universal stress UspA family protein